MTTITAEATSLHELATTTKMESLQAVLATRVANTAALIRHIQHMEEPVTGSRMATGLEVDNLTNQIHDEGSHT